MKDLIEVGMVIISVTVVYYYINKIFYYTSSNTKPKAEDMDFIQRFFFKNIPDRYDINTAKIGDEVQPAGIQLTPPLAWKIVGFVLGGNGQRVKTTIEHPITKDRISLEFIYLK